jgi:hypothetical protein
MILPGPLGAHELLGSAVIGVVREARWEAAELLSRRTPAAAADLLRGRAGELAASPSGRSQLASLALEKAAGDIQRGRSPISPGAVFFFGRAATPEARLEIQRAVFAGFRPVDEAAGRLTAELEAELRQRLDTAAGDAALSAPLLDAGRLHKLLWDDPRIPAAPGVRLVMVCSIPRLVDRARALDPLRLRALRNLVRRGGRAAWA